ncbi:clostripain-related cysteine peptidase [uncultured Bacteroides sp.]|uniref:clostripain-related cysteine peptidase n=1 Tax=uncultured Bacteroides sp. TaxID=162156 RepID=UPI002AA68A59|nr:clostripain-related cysteine peptidase [uncultured Bacteroides sp.]
MKKLFLLLSIALLLSSCHNHDEPDPVVATRTVLAYMGGDGLASFINDNVNDMIRGYSTVTTGNNLLIYMDGGSSSVDTLYKLVKNRSGIIEKKVIKTYQNQISTDKAVMEKVFSDAFTACPAESYGAIFSSHGTAWLPASKTVQSKSFGSDSGYQINIPEMALVLNDIASKFKRFDFLLFDACFMGSTEVAYEFKDVSDYLIASSGEILGAGFPYKDVTPYLFNTGEDNLKMIAQLFYNSYNTQSGAYRSAIVSVVNLNYMESLASQMKRIIGEHLVKVNSFSPAGFQYFDGNGIAGDVNGQHIFYDLKQFVDSLSTDDALFKRTLESAVIYKANTPNLSSEWKYEDIIPIDEFCGLSIYIPQQGRTAYNNFFKTLSWFNASGWNQTAWGTN